MAAHKITIFMSGGVINEVVSNSDVDVVIVDEDEIQDGNNNYIDHGNETYEEMYDKVRETQTTQTIRSPKNMEALEKELNQD